MLGGLIKPIIKNSALGKSDSGNYRPIMNSSNFLKIFEVILKKFLQCHIRLNNRQFGFRENTGCTSALIVLKETLKNYYSEKSNVHCAMVDVSKAFDKVDHNILIQKLGNTTLPKPIIDIIDIMLKNTYVSTCVNGWKTDSWKIDNGTRQGGIISPLLFSFYINEILDKISAMPVGCMLGGIRTNILCYADDICLLAPTSAGLQNMLDSMYDEIMKLRLSINVQKCAHIIFKSKEHYVVSNVSLGDTNVPRVSEYNYLGTILAEDLCVSEDVNRASNKYLKQYHSIYAKFYKMSDDVLHYLFRTHSLSFYGAELWYDSLSSRSVKDLAIAYHKGVKKVARLNVWDNNHLACDIVSVPIFNHLLSRRSICFLYSLTASKSHCLLPYHYYIRYHSHLRRAMNSLFHEKYGVIRALENPLLALLARIQFIQRTEPRTNYIYLPNH